jgi:hypothetical protein
MRLINIASQKWGAEKSHLLFAVLSGKHSRRQQQQIILKCQEKSH